MLPQGSLYSDVPCACLPAIRICMETLMLCAVVLVLISSRHVYKRALLTRLLSKFLVDGTCQWCWRVLCIRAYVVVLKMADALLAARRSVVACDALRLYYISFFQ